MEDLGTQSPWFSQEFLDTLRKQTETTELLKRYNLDGVEIPYCTDDEETICPHCGQPSNS